MTGHPNSFGTRQSLSTDEGYFTYFSLQKLAQHGFSGIDRLPYCIRILIENMLRNEDGILITSMDIEKLASWNHGSVASDEIPFMPARVLLQDFTGVPAVVDLAAMRDAAQRLYGTPSKINPLIPAELVIDHSVQVDSFGSSNSTTENTDFEYLRNSERYAFLRWGQKCFENFRVVPPSTGICHQVNLEYLATGVSVTKNASGKIVFPDTVVGLDSHTTMINGLGVLGWGVGGIEAEAVMLGRPYYLLAPSVIGFCLEGKLPDNVNATDLVLNITQMLREKGVVGKFVEFYGPGVSGLGIENRATVANMAPEYGATMGFFPVDEKTIDYLRLTGRDQKTLALMENYYKAQGLFRTDDSQPCLYSDHVVLDMSSVEPCLAGPKRPQERVLLSRMKTSFDNILKDNCGIPSRPVGAPAFWENEGGKSLPNDLYEVNGETCKMVSEQKDSADQDRGIGHGAVVIAAITSCTNTSNPSVLMAAGLMAKNAVEHGLTVKPWVKTSLAPGSRVALDYLKAAGLMEYLELLNFYPVAFGCTTCIGNSGPLPDNITSTIKEKSLIVASVLSGNRNFEGRINPLTRINYLASPQLVVAYAITGTVDIDFDLEPIGKDINGSPVFLKDIWPSSEEIEELVNKYITPDRYKNAYASVFEGDKRWKSLPTPEGALYNWDNSSTYIKEPPFFLEITREVKKPQNILGARVLALLGDSITTDHISPAGAIPVNSPAGQYLIGQNVLPSDFNSYGARRGNHEVMMRGTLANIRLKNKLTPDVDGGWTLLLPEGEKMSIYDAAMKYREKKTSLIIIAGKEYGTGSSRDWAAKGVMLLGVKAVIAESFERIHRSNLICMGILPLQFMSGESHGSIGLDGTETFDIVGIESDLHTRKKLLVNAFHKDGRSAEFSVVSRIDSQAELTYYQNGGILNYVLRNLY